MIEIIWILFLTDHTLFILRTVHFFKLHLIFLLFYMIFYSAIIFFCMWECSLSRTIYYGVFHPQTSHICNKWYTSSQTQLSRYNIIRDKIAYTTDDAWNDDDDDTSWKLNLRWTSSHIQQRISVRTPWLISTNHRL